MKKLLIGMLLAALIAGCSSTPTKEGGAPVEERTPSTAAGGAATTGTTGGNVTGTANAGQSNPLKDPNNILSKRIIYFDYDSYTIRDQDKALIEAHARYLQSSRNARLSIQGNTDERGSREYNIALGQRRADGVKKMMVLLGVTENQIDTVSFGEEKPRATGHDEASWSQNRRSDIVYAGE